MSDDAFAWLVIVCLVITPIVLAWFVARIIWPDHHDDEGP